MAGFKSAPAGGQRNEKDPIRIVPLGDMNFRSGVSTKDQRFVNGYFDVIKNSITGKTHTYFTKRPGTVLSQAVSAGVTPGRGVIFWPVTQKFYSVFNNKIFINGTDAGVTLATTTSPIHCGFAYTHPAATTQYLCVNDGVKLYCISTTDVVTTVTVNYPTPNTGDLVFMDRYMFVLKTDGTLWHCELDDPITWVNTKFITAQMYNGTATGLARLNNLIYLFTNQHMQAFFDNANVSGSVLNNYEQGVQQIGCAQTATIVSNENNLFWVSTGNTGYSVYQLTGTTGLKEIATAPIQRILQVAGKDSIQASYAMPVRVAGKFLYVLNLIPAASFTGRTLVYDPGLDQWSEWSAYTAVSDIFPAAASTISPAYTAATYFQIIDGPGNAQLAVMDGSLFTDLSQSYPVLCRFSRFDNDTTTRKVCSRIEMIGDKQSSTTNVSLQYSDDDYQTLSTARTFDMSLTRPFHTRFGPFYRRSHQLSYTGTNPLRIQGLDLYIKSGTDS